MVKALVSEIFDSEQKSKKNRKTPPAPIITEMDTGVYVYHLFFYFNFNNLLSVSKMSLKC